MPEKPALQSLPEPWRANRKRRAKAALGSAGAIQPARSTQHSRRPAYDSPMKHHPEQQEDEIYMGNDAGEGFDGSAWRTKRWGSVAMNSSGEPIQQSKSPFRKQLRPWFIKCHEIQFEIAALTFAARAGDKDRTETLRPILEQRTVFVESEESTKMSTELSTVLTADAVKSIFFDCLFKPDEPHDEYVVGAGIRQTFGFHPERIAAHRTEIGALLDCLPDEFRADKGGGWSFLNACMTRDGEQWGGHQNVEQLVALGIATKQAAFTLPREMWSMLPGGVPYFSVTTEAAK